MKTERALSNLWIGLLGAALGFWLSTALPSTAQVSGGGGIWQPVQPVCVDTPFYDGGVSGDGGYFVCVFSACVATQAGCPGFGTPGVPGPTGPIGPTGSQGPIGPTGVTTAGDGGVVGVLPLPNGFTCYTNGAGTITYCTAPDGGTLFLGYNVTIPSLTAQNCGGPLPYDCLPDAGPAACSIVGGNVVCTPPDGGCVYLDGPGTGPGLCPGPAGSTRVLYSGGTALTESSAGNDSLTCGAFATLPFSSTCGFQLAGSQCSSPLPSSCIPDAGGGGGGGYFVIPFVDEVAAVNANTVENTASIGNTVISCGVACNFYAACVCDPTSTCGTCETLSTDSLATLQGEIGALEHWSGCTLHASFYGQGLVTGLSLGTGTFNVEYTNPYSVGYIQTTQVESFLVCPRTTPAP